MATIVTTNSSPQGSIYFQRKHNLAHLAYHSPCLAISHLSLSAHTPHHTMVASSTAARHPTAVSTEAPESETATGQLLERSVNTIRFLAIDAVEKANFGSVGMSMGCAPMGHILFDEVMRYNPKNPYWFNRDRFVLSNGHGSMLQYALLHLAGYDSVREQDLKQLSQFGSRTPSHPANLLTPGVEVSTGAVGQGIANAVGLALAEKHLAARFNKPDNEIVNHFTYVILGDGCQMEGISSEACSLAGHWGLGKLVAFYDDNHMSADGDTEIAFAEDVIARFEAYGWHTVWVKNGNTGYDDIREAIKEAKTVADKPTLIKVTTTTGYGSPHKANSYSVHGAPLGTKEANSYSVHGAPLGTKEVEATRQNLGWPYEPFFVPEDVKSHWNRHVPRGAALQADWDAKFAEYEKKYPEDATTLRSIISGELPAGWADVLPKYTTECPEASTRNPSHRCLNELAKVLPGLLGGSADLAGSCKTQLKISGNFQKHTPEDRNICFGVREHGMGGICNGIALHSPGLIPYCGTYLAFSDYMRGAMRVSAMSEAGVIYVMTHDSIGVGENGSSHQPTEHLMSFRAMPNMLVLRPADGNETSGAYRVAVLNRKTPSVLALTRQNISQLPGTSMEGVEKGGYVISDNSSGNNPDLIVLGTGSELEIAAKAADELRKEGRTVRVVSLVCWELFEEQPDEYKESVLPESVTARISIEAGCALGWQKYVGPRGKIIAIDKFGTSAPAEKIYKEYGITVESVIAAAKSF